MNDQNSHLIPVVGYDSSYWRKRARMTLEKASSSEPVPKERLLRIAREYERMAEYAEARRAGAK